MKIETSGGDYLPSGELDKVIDLLLRQEVTLAPTAFLASLSFGEMIDILRSRGIPWAKYIEETMQKNDEANSCMSGRGDHCLS